MQYVIPIAKRHVILALITVFFAGVTTGQSAQDTMTTVKEKAAGTDAPADSNTTDGVVPKGRLGSITIQSQMDDSAAEVLDWELQKNNIAGRLRFLMADKLSKPSKVTLVFTMPSKRKELLRQPFEGRDYKAVAAPHCISEIKVDGHKGGPIKNYWAFYSYQVADMMDFLKKSVSWPLGTEPLCEIIDGGSQNENGQTTIGIALKIESSINPHDLKREVGTMRMKALLIPLMKEINAKKDFSSVDDVSVELLDHELKLRFSNYESTLSGLDDIKYLTEKMVEMANTINENIGIQTINLKTETREAKEFLEYTAENNSEETLELSCRINQKDDRRTISASKTISILEQELIKLYEWKKALQNQGSPIQVEFNYNQPVDDSETWITIGF